MEAKGEERVRQLRRLLLTMIAAGVVLNVLPNIPCSLFGLPLFLDTVGTIVTAQLGGLFPAIAVAVLGNSLASLFNQYSIYYSVLNVLMGILAVYFRDRGWLKKKSGLALFILLLALIGGIPGGLIQWALLGRPQYTAIAVAVESLVSHSKGNTLLYFLPLNFLLNLVDKTISVLAAYLIWRYLPEKRKEAFRTSCWRQRPVDRDELKLLTGGRRKKGRTLQSSMSGMLFAATLSLTVIMGFVSLRIYYENMKEERTEAARRAVRLAAAEIDTRRIGEYLKDGWEAEGYEEMYEKFRLIRENTPGVKYLYALVLRDDGCHFFVDPGTDGEEGLEPGSVIPFEEAFEPYLEDMFAGHQIEPIESNDISGWVLTVYRPVLNDAGRCVCYVGADVAMERITRFTWDYLLRTALIFSGYLMLILGYGLWMSRVYLVYPINSLAAVTEEFGKESNEQEDLERDVEKIRSLEIHTGDEVENLYHVLCRMSSNTATQVKDIRHYAEAVAQMQNGLIITMADMVENRDSDTGAHVQKTSAYVRIILEGLKRKGYYADKLTAKYISDVEMSAPLHDVGKVAIPDAILNKPGKLTDEEYEIMKTHATAGRKIMERAIATVQGENYLKEARNMAAYHHEKWDGSGYPEHLKGEVIPLSARVMAVADVFDALVSKRVYKPGMPLEKALGILQEGAGSHFDPKCIEVFMESLDEVKQVMKKYREDVT
ncbi:MAG: HD domain-containing protein [Lachnospiraceae bacterium]|nr:HD domain-containing protein [Lachnospiraceae bacterium]